MQLDKEKNTITFNIMELFFYTLFTLSIITLINVIDNKLYPQEDNFELSLLGILFATIVSFIFMRGYGSGKFVSKIKF